MNDSEKITGSLALKPKPRIITIPATGQDLTRPLRVAAYARVSSDSNDQLHSYAAQTAYFAKLINSNPNWIFADIYADQGITGTSVEKRDDFLRMMEDSRSGRIDRILVKSTSRFARNIKESLEAVRELKSLGVSVYFEEQNIDTAQATGEALTAVFSALAQKESESISERMRHSYQMRMQRGVFSTRCAPYGYRLVDNQLEVIEDEAVVIRQIFDRYLSGISMEDIAKEITARGIPTKQNTPFWQVRSIQYILRNEKYIGNSLVQKTYATVTLPHRKKENKGEEDQYLIEETHPPIVSQEVFDKVQRLLSRKSAFIPPRASTPHPFSCKIVCGHCGAICKRKVCRGTAYWVCQTHEKSAESCLTIFEWYLAGRSVQNIRQALEASGVRNAAGTTEWTTSNLRSILTNEKYCGDALLQKTFIKDCISKKAILNTGQLPKVLIQDNHEAIVSREMFDAVQLEIARRRAQDGRTRKSAPTGRGKFSGKYALSGLLFCAECGTAYRRVVWTQHGEKRAVWRCTSRLDYGKRYCLHSPTLDEGPLQQAILSAVNSAMSDHGTLTAQLIDAMEQELAPIPGESISLGDIDRATEGLGQQFNDLLREAADANNVDSYTAQFQSISTAMAEFKRRKAKILQIRQEQEQTNRRVQAVASVLKTASSELMEWDDNVIYQLLEKVTVLSRERIRVTLRDGLEIEQAVEQPKRRKFT